MRDISFLVRTAPDVVTIGGGAHPTASPSRPCGSRRSSTTSPAARPTGTVADPLDGKRRRGSPAVGGARRATTSARPSARPRGRTPTAAHACLGGPSTRSSPTPGDAPVAPARPKSPPSSSPAGASTRATSAAQRTPWGAVTARSRPSAAEEMAYLQSPRLLRGSPLSTTSSPRTTIRAAAVCEEIIRRDIKFGWTCNNGIRPTAPTPSLFTPEAGRLAPTLASERQRRGPEGSSARAATPA